MRITERLMYFLGICLAITYGLELLLWSLIFIGLIIIVTVWGIIYEGLRIPQFIFLIAFIPQIILVILNVFNIIALIVYSFFLLFAIIYTLIFGESNVNRIEMSGPYQVGHQDIYSEKDGIVLSVYYPMDIYEYKNTINKPGRNSYWLRNGYQGRLGIAKAMANYGEENHPNSYNFKYLDNLKMNTVQDGNLSNDFNGSEDTEKAPKKLIPMIYCHGLTCNRTALSGSCRDFASHGYIVFSFDHFDNTCYYSINKDGQEKYWDSLTFDPKNSSFIYEKLQKRISEVSNFIDDLQNQLFLQETLGFSSKAQLDLEKLIIGGHSFGGGTAIAASWKDERIKCTFSMDPWVYSFVKSIKNNECKLTQPQMHVFSSHFNDKCLEFFQYDTIKELKNMIQNSSYSHQAEILEIRNTSHVHQTDAIVIIPLEGFLMMNHPIQFNYTSLYMLNSQSVLHWLNRVGFSNSYDLSVIEKHLYNKMKQKYLNYLIYYDPLKKTKDIEADDHEIIDDENQQLLNKQKLE